MTPRVPSPSRPRARGGRRPVAAGGFTLIEILVAIGIIVVLVGLVAVGMPKVIGGSRERATRTNIDVLMGMLTELEVGDRALSRLSPFYETATPPTPVIDAPRIVSADAYDAAVPAQADRYKSPAVEKTRQTMGVVTSIAANQQAISRLSADSLLKDDPSNNTGANNTPARPAENEAIPPVLLDAWGNPIIFVPKGGLRNVRVSDGSGTRLVTVTSVAVAPVGSPTPGVARPFWASAGPDGSFGSKPGPNGTYGDGDDLPAGDDNVYSFEN